MSRKGTTSNNPTGRPPGLGVVAQLRAELLPGDKLSALVTKVYDLALAGNMAAVRILLDRVLPPLRAQAARVQVDVPAGTLTDQAKALLAAATTGAISTDQAAELITAISRVVQVEQGDELRRRLDALEFGDIA